MAQATLNYILEQLKMLEASELRQLGQAVQERLLPHEEARKREASHRALLAAGLVKQIKKPQRTNVVRPPLITVQGKPLSETIMEERR